MKKRREARGAGRAGKGERAARSARKNSLYILRLYITGSTPRAKAAVMKVKSFCEEHLKNNYELDIIDIYQQPSRAKDEQIIAAPTLIKKLPRPLQRLVGDFSSTDRVMSALGLHD